MKLWKIKMNIIESKEVGLTAEWHSLRENWQLGKEDRWQYPHRSREKLKDRNKTIMSEVCRTWLNDLTYM